MAESTMRPNIRIEIHNNLVEPMEVEEEEKVDEVEEEEEEGEISDANEADLLSTFPQKQQVIRPVPTQRIWPNANGGFTTGINIFDKEEQLKLVERAKRFALDLNDVSNFTDEQLQELHDSLGITTEEEKDIRFEAIHMRGTDDMSTDDVLEYFGKFGPAGIEWINDESCNVVWDDKISAARALFFLSKSIKGMPVEGPCDPFVKDLESKETDDKENESRRSILLKNKDREVELREDEVIGEVDISSITVPIPPGYWRLGATYLKSKFILLRFAFKSDKKPMKAERFSEYYKKYGNPNFGGLKGLITETRKQKFKGIFDRNRDIQKDEEIPDDPKNPWGALAKNWNEDARYCEKETESVPKSDGGKVNAGKSGIMSRLGFKRSLDSESVSKPEENNVEKKTKVPRMRMYADDEEEKIKCKRQLQELKMSRRTPKNSNSVDDLRNILKVASRRNQIKVETDDKNDNEDTGDLGTKLKNRNRNRNDRIDSDVKQSEEEDKKIELHEVHHKESRKKETKTKKDKYKRHHRKSPDRYEKRLHSDRRENQRKDDDFYENDFNNHKPKSKIAVVIKTQKKPAVASTVWSRIHSERERLKTVSEGKLRIRRDSNSSSSSESETSTSESSSSESSDSEEESPIANLPLKTEKADRPGFRGDLPFKLGFNPGEHRSPLRIEISNDHFKKQ